jgi:outer membrane protein assembly factor BamB
VARLIALDTKAGEELWNRLVADPADGYFLNAPPAILDYVIFIGPVDSG